MIQDYYQDHEKFKFVLQKPFLKLDLVRSSKIELVRLSHSNKKSKTYAPTEKSAKNYTWTWRFDEPSVQFFKRKYIVTGIVIGGALTLTIIKIIDVYQKERV